MSDNVVLSLDLRFQQETIKIINSAGNLMNLNLNKKEATVLEEKFKISQNELTAEIRLIRSRSDCTNWKFTNDIKWTDPVDARKRKIQNLHGF